MTEDEAHLKQCCGPEGCGHFNDQPYPARWCTGSTCMAWRDQPGNEGFLVSVDGGPEEEWRWDPTDHPTWRGRVKVRQLSEERHGYCGLAGQPS